MTERPNPSPTELARLTYSVEEAAKVLGIGRTFMFRLLSTGRIESFKIGKSRKVTPEALSAYIQRELREQANGSEGARAPSDE